MDISTYIQDLLWDYECVIIPGFGGIIASYQSASIVLAEHSLYPPSKSLAFNEYLSQNDGLLINYILQKEQINYTEASERVDSWVKSTQGLLINNEEILLPLIGRFYLDIEKQLIFEPDTSVNYLPSSYGLRKVIAEPLLRINLAESNYNNKSHLNLYQLPRSNKKLPIAAIIILFLSIGALVNLMYARVDIKPLHLNAANVMGFLENFNKHPVEVKPPLKVTLNKEIPLLNYTNEQLISPSVNAAASKQSSTIEPSGDTTSIINEIDEKRTISGSADSKKYYIIIGAFKKRSNFQNAETYLKSNHSVNDIYEDTSLEKRRIGFYAGDNYNDAIAKLNEARKDQQDYWLLVKR